MLTGLSIQPALGLLKKSYETLLHWTFVVYFTKEVHSTFNKSLLDVNGGSTNPRLKPFVK